jgi:regulator of PEP synthase PpsR (kinase-PPPase family)
MKKTAKEIIEEVRGDNRERMMIYLDKNLQAEFKKFCLAKKVRMSTVIEKLIENFMEEMKVKK